MKHYQVIGAPVGTGAGQSGCQLGPEAYRVLGIVDALKALGLSASDQGDVAPDFGTEIGDIAPVKNLGKAVAWTRALEAAAFDAYAAETFPIFLGGDHSLSMGPVAGAARYAASAGRPLFLLWLDAHPDFHRLDTTASGNLHGTPVAYVSGQPGFDRYFPPVTTPVQLANVCMIGIRSVVPMEHALLVEKGVEVCDMRQIDEHGITRPLTAFLDRVAAENGLLHVSLDVDFLDPAIAPGVGTTVPGGVTFREAHLVMEILHESDLVTSLDLVELNPLLDHAGKTCRLMIDLASSLMGKRIMDRRTKGA